MHDPERWTRWLENKAYMRIEDGRCAALNGTLCAIYEERPEICRALERGSPACEAEILRKGIRSGRSPIPT
jgi:Fe-S-cluster containining protein